MLKINSLKNIFTLVLLGSIFMIMGSVSVVRAEQKEVGFSCPTGRATLEKTDIVRYRCPPSNPPPGFLVGTPRAIRGSEVLVIKVDCGPLNVSVGVGDVFCDNDNDLSNGSSKPDPNKVTEVRRIPADANAAPISPTATPDVGGGGGDINRAVDPAITCEVEKQGSDCDLIKKYLNPIIKFLSFAVGIVVTGVIILGGIQYSASGGDPGGVAAAKKRIINAFLALAFYMFSLAILNWLIPGGLV